MAFTFSHGDGKSADNRTDVSGDLIKDTTRDSFMTDVIDASCEVPVIVDFWADWCGPCKQLTPMLEKAVTAAKGAVRLVKVNVDENREIAAQLRVQSLPTIYAFKDGRPIDALVGALPESRIKDFIEKIVGAAVGPSDDEMLIEAGRRAIEEEDFDVAIQAFTAALQADAENAAAIAGLARAQIGAGLLEEARATLDMTPEDKRDDGDIGSARAALELAATSVDSSEIAALAAKVEADEKDHRSRIDLALALNAEGRPQEAMDHLLASIRLDRAWNDEAARKQLLQFFEAWGDSDEHTISGRRQLSSILFS